MNLDPVLIEHQSLDVGSFWIIRGFLGTQVLVLWRDVRVNASTTVLCFNAILISYNKCCSSELRGRLARWRFQRGNYWRWIAVSINHEQRQVMCVFWGTIVSNR